MSEKTKSGGGFAVLGNYLAALVLGVAVAGVLYGLYGFEAKEAIGYGAAAIIGLACVVPLVVFVGLLVVGLGLIFFGALAGRI
jgi:hypothetical protein